MAHTRDVTHTIIARASADPLFAQALLQEAATLFLNGEAYLAKTILRDLVNATVGFEQLARQAAKPSKSVHRMLSQSGNPTMSNLAAIFQSLKDALHVQLQATTLKIAYVADAVGYK
jgi:DNA-binding phage protein